VAFARAMIGVFGLGPGDATLGFASLSFDVSVMDMFLPLLSGGRVVIVPPQVRRSPPGLAGLINAASVTYACLTPSVMGLLTGYEFPGLRYLVSGGEELSGELAAAWQEPGRGPVLYNTYGPTEAAVVTTWVPLRAGGPVPPPIGWPLPNYRAYILDDHLCPVPLGVTGELYIGGPGVARGYLNRPALTAARFIADPFGDVLPGTAGGSGGGRPPEASTAGGSGRGRPPRASTAEGGRLYKSGDLVRRRADGTIVFCGRADHQVKIRGLRIELGEVEAALEACPGVARSVVTVITDTAGDQQLAGYVQPAPGADPDPGQIRKQLAAVLPAALIPAYLTVLAELPLNTSGKVSRDALPQPALPGQDTAVLAEPATATETALTGLYATVLGRERVGATDSFFEIGGSSLQVMRLVDLIGRELGAEVGVATVFLHPTPRGLAASIDAPSGERPDGQGPLVPLSQGSLGPDRLSQHDGEPPLFLVHAVGGTVFAYAGLASELAGPFRVYGLEAPGLSQQDATPASLGALADDYAGRIRAAQPSGPYRLGGWSMGGVIAFEVARRLEQAGQRVSLLVLMDAPFTQPDTAALTEAQLAGQFLADATHSLGWDAAAAPDPGRCGAAEQLAWLADRLRAGNAGEAGLDVVSHGGVSYGGVTHGSGDEPPDRVAAQLERRFAVFRAHIRMLAGYRPSAPAVAAPALIVSAGDSPNAPAAGHWPAVLAGQVQSLRLPGDHYAFLRPPLVGELGRAIRDAAGWCQARTGGTDQMELRPTAEEERAHVDRVRAGGAGRATSRRPAKERFRAHPAPPGRDHEPAAVVRAGAAVVCRPVRPWHADVQHHVRPAADRPAGPGGHEPGGRRADHAP
jgi:amino acid adenylation domain-containing protein